MIIIVKARIPKLDFNILPVIIRRLFYKYNILSIICNVPEIIRLYLRIEKRSENIKMGAGE